jgi:PilZ domain.
MTQQSTQQSPQKPSADQAKRETGVRLSLDIGTRMAISIGASNAEESRVAADLVGMVHFEYLIARLPWVPGLRTRLVGGTAVTVRFVSKGDLCGFQVPIVTHIAKPSLLLFIEYPEIIEKLALRQHKRLQCALPVQIHSRRGDGQGIVADLSQGGCRVAVDIRGTQELRQTVVGDMLVMHLPLNSKGVPTSVSCTVRSVDLDPTKMTLGLAFTEADDEFWTNLNLFMDISCLLP